MAKRSLIDKFLALSDEEKAAEVRRAADAPSRPLTVAERAEWKRVQAALKAKHKTRGRPVTGRGVKVISLSVEKELLARADAHAKRHGISRAQLVARGLQAVLG